MMPQKQGTLQFNGSRNRGSSVALAISGSRVSTGVGVLVGVTVGLGWVAVMVGVRVDGGGVFVWPGVIVLSEGAHPVTAKIMIAKRNKQPKDFICKPFPIVRIMMILISKRTQCISYIIMHLLPCSFS